MLRNGALDRGKPDGSVKRQLLLQRPEIIELFSAERRLHGAGGIRPVKIQGGTPYRGGFCLRQPLAGNRVVLHHAAGRQRMLLINLFFDQAGKRGPIDGFVPTKQLQKPRFVDLEDLRVPRLLFIKIRRGLFPAHPFTAGDTDLVTAKSVQERFQQRPRGSVVAVDKAYQLRPRRFHPPVAGGGLAAVALMDHPDKIMLFRKGIADFTAAVCRPVVHKNDLIALHRLIYYAVETSLKILSRVIYRNDHRDIVRRIRFQCHEGSFPSDSDHHHRSVGNA